MTQRLFILSAVVFAYLLVRQWEQRPISHAPGVLVPEIPVQVDLQPSAFMMDEYQLTRRAEFEIRARVLSAQNYYLHTESDLSPIDLALGWGLMSDQAVLDRIKISQSSRWYRSRWAFPAPLSEQQFIANSSNMHMIPASKAIGRSLKELRSGDLVI